MKYRREIDGLRAVAVLPVILFHAGFNTFEGGFVGVDVFFVISGYLITTIILSDMSKGKFSIVTFYERRARRILPALFCVMFCCLPFAWLWLTPNHLKEFCQSLIGVAAFSSNILFLMESGYFGTAAELKPLLHTWSLSVEEQYYVLFPLFLMALWKLRKRWIFGSLIVVAVISLIVAQWGAYNNPTATFFLLPTRGWELAIGALIAFYFLHKREHSEFITSHKPTSEVLGLLGLALICYSIFAFSKATPFPSFYALVPTIGTALIIIFATSETIAGRLLSTKAMVGIGLISYSTYLWHQPLFAFARHQSFTEPTTTLLLILSTLSIVLAYFSWRFVEIPFRDKNAFDRKKIFTCTIVGSFAFVVLGMTGHINNGFENRYTISQSVESSLREHELPKNFEKEYGVDGDEIEVFLLGSNAKDAEKVAVFGDSHSTIFLQAFDVLGKQQNYSVFHIGLGGCPPLIGVDVGRGNYSKGVCENLSKREYEYVQRNNIKKVFLISRWSLYTDGDYEKNMAGFFLVANDDDGFTQESSRFNFTKAFNNTVKAYNRIGVDLIVFLQAPMQKNNPKNVYYKLSKYEDKEDILSEVSISYIDHLDLQLWNRQLISNISGVKYINFDRFFCDENKCSIGDNNYSYYYDKDHLSTYGTLLLIEDIEPLLH